MYWREITGKLNNIYSELQCTGEKYVKQHLLRITMYWREIPGKLSNIYSELQCTGEKYQVS